MYFKASSLDDLMNAVLTRLLRPRASHIFPGKGAATELVGVMLELTNPRARLSRTETKGTLFSCLGEFLWYMAGKGDLETIKYYIKKYEDSAEKDGTINGAYGPRLFSMDGVNQIGNVIAALKKRDSRQAVIQLFRAADINRKFADVPCTCTLQFMRRHGQLHMLTNMRSNDAFLGLPHDVFAFTMLQEILARSVGVEVGRYCHSVGSLHLYDDHRKLARSYLDEGFQTHVEMPEMPLGDPWQALSTVLAVEQAARNGQPIPQEETALPPYWKDFSLLLQIMAKTRKMDAPTTVRDLREVVSLKSQLSTPIYASQVRRREERVASPVRDLLSIETV
jgi:thymidylate synthase